MTFFSPKLIPQIWERILKTITQLNNYFCAPINYRSCFPVRRGGVWSQLPPLKSSTFLRELHRKLDKSHHRLALHRYDIIIQYRRLTQYFSSGFIMVTPHNSVVRSKYKLLKILMHNSFINWGFDTFDITCRIYYS